MKKAIVLIVATLGLHTESLWLMGLSAAYVMLQVYLEIKNEKE